MFSGRCERQVVTHSFHKTSHLLIRFILFDQFVDFFRPMLLIALQQLQAVLKLVRNRTYSNDYSVEAEKCQKFQH